MNSLEYIVLSRRLDTIEKKLGIESSDYVLTADDVKSLRNKTGATMNDCKMALILSHGNLEEASYILKRRY